MVENNYETNIVACCTDLDIKILSQDLYEIQTAKSKYTIQSKTEERDTFLHIFDTILPKLNGSAPLNSVLSKQELSLFRPLISQLHRMGIIFFLNSAVANYVITHNDISLYTYLARRTTNPDPFFLQIKQQKVALYGSKLLIDNWAAVLRTQGLSVVEPQSIGQNQVPTVDKDVSLVILTVIGEDAAFLQVTNQHFYEQKIRWIPIIIEPMKIQLGPWIDSLHETPCYSCLVSNRNGHVQSQEIVNDPFKPRRAITSWSSLQPSTNAWVGGLLAQMVLRALVPISGEDPPWGRVTTLDVVALSQETKHIWKYPYCPVCSKQAPRVQQWVEV
jgi:bacteriocin biosynthesis cyclodehydratase domain-containing protein